MVSRRSFPGKEYNGDLRKLTTTAPVTTDETPNYRPLLRAPPSMKQPPQSFLQSRPRPSAPRLLRCRVRPAKLRRLGARPTRARVGRVAADGRRIRAGDDRSESLCCLRSTVRSKRLYSKTGTRLAAFTEDNLWWSGVGDNGLQRAFTGRPGGRLSTGYGGSLSDHCGSRSSPAVDPTTSASLRPRPAIPLPAAGGFTPWRMGSGGTGLPPAGYLNDHAKFGHWHDFKLVHVRQQRVQRQQLQRCFVCVIQPVPTWYSGAPPDPFAGFSRVPCVNQIFGMAYQATTRARGRTLSSRARGIISAYESLTTFAFNVRKFTPGANCGAGGTHRCGDEREPDVVLLYTSMGAEVPQPNTTNKARQHRRPDHAEGAIPQDRRRRIAMGDAQRGCGAVRADGDAVGPPNKCDRRHAG